MTTVVFIESGLELSSVPILALVDGDPYGIDILSVYRYGSRSLQHESKKLAAGRIRWLGLWSSELDEYVYVVRIFSRSVLSLSV
jgi:DNA topoisomerase VI subunit A